jgi:hypothetical protein
VSVDYVILTISAMFKETCAFLNQQISKLEEIAHGRSHNLNDENDRIPFLSPTYSILGIKLGIQLLLVIGLGCQIKAL